MAPERSEKFIPTLPAIDEEDENDVPHSATSAGTDADAPLPSSAEPTTVGPNDTPSTSGGQQDGEGDKQNGEDDKQDGEGDEQDGEGDD